MRVLLDDRECPVRAHSVGTAVAAAAEIAERDGRRVVDVEVDGERWGETELNSPTRLAVLAGEVRLTTAAPAELLRETFVHAAQALLDAESLQRQAAKLIQGDQSKEGFDTLLEALSLWSTIQQATVQGLAFGGIAPSEVRTAQGSLEDAAGELNARLRSLRDAMQQGDSVAVCDCLLYEFPPTTKRWAELLAELAKGTAGNR
jgi:hypothetical protein